MKMRAVVCLAILLCFGASIAMADTVSASASFTGGLNGIWKFQYASSPSGPDLESIAINLATAHLAFDTATGNFGYLTYLDFSNYQYSDPSTTMSRVGGADGSTWVIFNFGHFLPGDSFQFSADVDRSDPKYLPVSCASGLAGAGCRFTNGTNAGIAELVGPNQMAGAGVTFTFGGNGYDTTTLTGTFQQVTFQEIINRLITNGPTGAFDTNLDANAPEPASLATFGAGLGLLIGLAARRRRV